MTDYLPDIVLQLLSLLSSAIALIHAVSVINVMSKRTKHSIRMVYCVLATSAFANLAFIMSGGAASLHGTIITIAVSVMCIADRRRVGMECSRRYESRDIGRHPHAGA